MKLLSRLRRRPVVEPWPRNVRTVADDLREAYERLAVLAAKLTDARQLADVAAARTRAAEERAERFEAGLELARQQGADLHCELREVTAERDSLRIANTGLQRQLHDAMGYDDADQYAIATGTGQPRKA